MYPLLRSSSFFFLAIMFSSLELSTPFRIIKDEAKFVACSQRFNCGNKQTLNTFLGGDQIQDCGPPEYRLECHDSTYIEIEIVSRKFSVLGIRQMDQTLTVVGKDIMDDGCPDRLSNITIGDSPFECASTNAKPTYAYNCRSGIIPSTIPPESRCERNVEPVYIGFFEVGPEHGDPSCNSRNNVPILHKYNLDLMHKILTAKEAVKRGFDLRYNDVYARRDCRECMESAGQCGYNGTSHEFVCFLLVCEEPNYCPDVYCLYTEFIRRSTFMVKSTWGWKRGDKPLSRGCRRRSP